MNDLEIFSANIRIGDKVITDLRQLFDFFKRQDMYNCKIYIVFAVERFLTELKGNL